MHGNEPYCSFLACGLEVHIVHILHYANVSDFRECEVLGTFLPSDISASVVEQMNESSQLLGAWGTFCYGQKSTIQIGPQEHVHHGSYAFAISLPNVRITTSTIVLRSASYQV